MSDIWPKELLYFRRMGSWDISAYVKKTPPDKSLILIVWGVLEAHGPYLPLCNDSHLASLAADKVCIRLVKEFKIQPLIFDSFIDIGSPSATIEFPGSLGFSSHPVPVIQEVWEQTLSRLTEEGFRNFFLVNGDGGNWLNHWSRLKWDSEVIKKLAREKKITLEGSNWDQEGGAPYVHGGVEDHALIKWALDFAPEFERLSAVRHGLKAVDENLLKNIDNTKASFLEEELYRLSDWSKYQGQKKLRGVVEFSLKKYRRLLYDKNGRPLKEGGIKLDFTQKIDHLLKRILKTLNLRPD